MRSVKGMGGIWKVLKGRVESEYDQDTLHDSLKEWIKYYFKSFLWNLWFIVHKNVKK